MRLYSIARAVQTPLAAYGVRSRTLSFRVAIVRMAYPGIDGFLGTRASFMLDVVVLAMMVVVPSLGASVALARYGRWYAAHKWIQLGLAAALLATVAAFELDMRLHGWQARAARTAGEKPPAEVYVALYAHLVFAVSSAVLWVVVVVRALRHFPSPPTPNPHSRWHRRWGRVAAIDMGLTAVSGWIFYWLAFVA